MILKNWRKKKKKAEWRPVFQMHLAILEWLFWLQLPVNKTPSYFFTALHLIILAAHDTAIVLCLPSESNLVIPMPISQTEKHTYLVFQSPANIYLRLKATVVQRMPRQACSGGNSVLPHSPRSSLPTGSCFDVPMLYSLALSSWLLALPRSSSDGEQGAATALLLGFHSIMRCDLGLPFSPDTAQNTISVVTTHPSCESGQPVSKA